MTSPYEPVIIECPACGNDYEAWYRGSVNRWITPCDDEEIERSSTFTCPHCHCEARLGMLVSDKTRLNFQVPQARFKRKDEPLLYWVNVESVPPDQRVRVMQIIRSATHLDLPEVKWLLDHLPQTVMEDQNEVKAGNLKQRLEAAGARVTLKYF